MPFIQIVWLDLCSKYGLFNFVDNYLDPLQLPLIYISPTMLIDLLNKLIERKNKLSLKNLLIYGFRTKQPFLR